MNMDAKALIVFLLIGLVAGWLASFIVGGGGLIKYLVSGVLGAFVGPFVLRGLNINLGIANPLVSQIVHSTIGAIIVVVIARLIG
ncbi:MAG: GlsB/YeaQ/YmgE family stress response membrane protein [Mesorhizobium sp.]